MAVIVPESVEGAVEALAEHPGATVLAGGTDLMVEVNDGRRSPERIVAVSRIAELGRVRVDDGFLEIGAAATFAQLELDPVARLAPALAYAARTVGSPQIRNAATIGGNLATASPAGDALPVLLALGASVVVAASGGVRTVPSADFFTGPKRSVLRAGELITGVRVPIRRGPQDYLKVGVRNAMVIAVASLAISVDLDARTMSIGLGSVGPTPLAARDACAWAAARATWTEERVGLSDADIDDFGDRVAAAAQPIDDHRSTAQYRRRAVRVLARRALRRCAP